MGMKSPTVDLKQISTSANHRKISWTEPGGHAGAMRRSIRKNPSLDQQIMDISLSLLYGDIGVKSKWATSRAITTLDLQIMKQCGLLRSSCLNSLSFVFPICTSRSHWKQKQARLFSIQHAFTDWFSFRRPTRPDHLRLSSSVRPSHLDSI